MEKSSVHTLPSSSLSCHRATASGSNTLATASLHPAALLRGERRTLRRSALGLLLCGLAVLSACEGAQLTFSSGATDTGAEAQEAPTFPNSSDLSEPGDDEEQSKAKPTPGAQDPGNAANGNPQPGGNLGPQKPLDPGSADNTDKNSGGPDDSGTGDAGKGSTPKQDQPKNSDKPGTSDPSGADESSPSSDDDPNDSPNNSDSTEKVDETNAPKDGKQEEGKDNADKDQGPDDGSSNSGDSETDSDTHNNPDENTPTNNAVELWEIVYNPKGSDGGVDSPEVIDLLLPKGKSAKEALSFTLRGEGWPELSGQDFVPASLDMPPASILRIERYKNEATLQQANEKYPTLQIVDNSRKEIAVQILRTFGGKGLRNKGGWVLLDRSPDTASPEANHGVIYGDIKDEKVDPELLQSWNGPNANPAPDGDALCPILEAPSEPDTSAAWWTPCTASTWGRDD